MAGTHRSPSREVEKARAVSKNRFRAAAKAVDLVTVSDAEGSARRARNHDVSYEQIDVRRGHDGERDPGVRYSKQIQWPVRWVWNLANLFDDSGSSPKLDLPTCSLFAHAEDIAGNMANREGDLTNLPKLSEISRSAKLFRSVIRKLPDAPPNIVLN